MQLTITIPDESVEAFAKVYERPEQIQDPSSEGDLMDNPETKEEFLLRKFEEHGVTVCIEYGMNRFNSGELKEADIDYELGEMGYRDKIKTDLKSAVELEKNK